MQSPSNSVCIKIENLRKSYNWGKVRALDGIDLTVHAGEIFGLIGPNGAGKTTLMGCLLSALVPTSGKILINGLAPDDIAVRKITGFLPERPHFDAWMKVDEFLRYHHMLAKRSSTDVKGDIEEVLEAVALESSVGKRLVRQLSRGMLQRLGLAQVLIGKPKLCFLDEPTSGMDPVGMALVRKLLMKWKREGVTVILNSHHLDEVERVCDRVAFIKGGKIEALEQLSLPAMDKLSISVRWSGNLAENLNQIISDLAKQCNSQLEEFDDTSAKFSLPDRKSGPQLIRNLVMAGIEVEEATLERKNLHDFFLQSAEGDWQK
ncbi:MAG TPA: ABC transporter ATP-binding protein [Oculatellaceae cyanobacterium]